MRKALEFIGAAILFILAYTQSPLYFSNQNQYLLHGAADAQVGLLEEDWLATSRDPTPVFSAIITTVYRLGVPELIFMAYGLIMALYLVSAVVILSRLPSPPKQFAGRWIAFAFILLTHAALFRWLSVLLVQVDYPWYFQSGVAGQYLLGAGFQPSVFGVLLLTSLATFLSGWTTAAILFACLAALLHFTYLLPAALMCLGYSVAIIRDNGWKAAVRFLGLAALGLVCVTGWNAYRFQPENEEIFAEAQRLLVTVRIPHHAQIMRWLDPIAILQMVWIVLTIVLVRKSRIAIVLGTVFVGSVLLTGVTAVTEWPLFMLVFPWRVSAVLVPLSTIIISARLASSIESSRLRRPAFVLAGIVVVASAVAGVVFPFADIGYSMNEAAEQDLLEFVRRTKQSGDVYLIPTRIPKLSGGKRGSISTSFTPPPRPTPGSNLIPVDLQRFRLATGAPIYVDFKSIPYADQEVIEWYRRMQQAEEWYANQSWSMHKTQEELQQEGITHVIVPANQAINDPAYTPVYQGEHFHVYRLAYR